MIVLLFTSFSYYFYLMSFWPFKYLFSIFIFIYFYIFNFSFSQGFLTQIASHDILIIYLLLLIIWL